MLASDTINLWEDDYCQVEIIPIENLDYIKVKTTAIDSFAEKHKTENGFTKIYERSGNPTPTKLKHIKVADLETVFESSGQKRIKNILIQLQTTVDYEDGKTRAFGDKNFVVFFERKDDLVENIWISTKYIADKIILDKATITLRNLGDKFNLILVDWNTSEIVDLKDVKQVKMYLNGYDN
ncbi:MAG: hypothetical protein H7Z76_09165 [Methylotenera sp.]|nr:hypothetical protein [Flavobacterium sp.]